MADRPRPELRLVGDREDPAEGTGAPSEQLSDWSIDGIFRRYGRYVAAIGLRLLGQPDEVDDLVQDVFVRAWRHLGDLRDPEGIKAWLAKIAVREAYRRLARRRRRRRWFGVGSPVDLERIRPENEEMSPEQRVLLHQTFRALDQLPPKLRIPWTLRYFQGEELTAIALLCECSLATVKRRIAKAQTLLEKRLAE